MFDKNIFCYRLKEERTKLKLTQSELGRNFDFPKQYISRWEKGEQEPPLSKLIDLADFFDVSLDYLVGRSDSRDRN